MNIAAPVVAAPRLAGDKPISLAILAMGGQGGGVLADWIVALAEANGWHAQSTSVPGVAQRTGATIYYIEMLPARDGVPPVMSLMPSPGDVDIVLSAEWMEAGRSMLRGIVTPDRTTLIASTHRSFAVGEKEKPGDGIGDPAVVTAASGVAAKRVIAFDMEAVAVRAGSVISASMFGALAGAGVLPFDAPAFEAVIRAGGKGIEPSLKAFAAGRDRAAAATAPEVPPGRPAKRFEALPDATGHPALDAVVRRIRDDFAEALRPMLQAGARRLVDFQDPAYAGEYLDRVGAIAALDARHGGASRDWALTAAAAKHVAVAMAYDDVIGVADLKTRASRFDRVRAEVGAAPGEIVYMTEYMHPRGQEIVGLMPARLGAWIEARPRLFRGIDRLVDRGRRVKTGTIGWFLALYVVSGLRRFRRGTLRHRGEQAHLDAWLVLAARHVESDYALAVEILAARRLVKGYSDTHARGTAKFDRVLGALPLLAGRADAAAWLRRLVQAALLDEEGAALDGALKTIATL